MFSNTRYVEMKFYLEYHMRAQHSFSFTGWLFLEYSFTFVDGSVGMLWIKFYIVCSVCLFCQHLIVLKHGERS